MVFVQSRASFFSTSTDDTCFISESSEFLFPSVDQFPFDPPRVVSIAPTLFSLSSPFGLLFPDDTNHSSPPSWRPPKTFFPSSISLDSFCLPLPESLLSRWFTLLPLSFSFPIGSLVRVIDFSLVFLRSPDFARVAFAPSPPASPFALVFSLTFFERDPKKVPFSVKSYTFLPPPRDDGSL